MTLKQTFLLTSLSAFFLTGCSDKQNFQEAVLAKMKADPDLKDYHIEPERMRDCVVDTVGQNMPGIFFADPERLKAFQSYTKMLSLAKSSDPQKALAELRNEFGSAKALFEANRNFSESVLLCQTALTSESDPAVTNDFGAPVAPATVNSTAPEATPAANPTATAQESIAATNAAPTSDQPEAIPVVK